MKFGQKIELLRTRAGFTQLELANLVGISQKSVSDWIKKDAMPRKATLKKLSVVFDVDPNVLTDDSLDLPEWSPPEKVAETFSPGFAEHLKQIKKQTESHVIAELDRERVLHLAKQVEEALGNLISELEKPSKHPHL